MLNETVIIPQLVHFALQREMISTDPSRQLIEESQIGATTVLDAG